MANFLPVVRAASSVLIHTPGLTRYGSKPQREIAAHPARLAQLSASLRSYQEAQGYLPNQVFIGQQAPEKLTSVSRPWFRENATASGKRKPFGSIIDERSFLALIALADPFKHVALLDRFWEDNAALLQSAICRSLAAAAPNVVDLNRLNGMIARGDGLPLFAGNDVQPVGWIANGHHEDHSLSATVLLENLCGKVSAALSLQEIFVGNGGLKKQDVDFVLGCSEEAVGDRYQRGGGNLAKAIAEFAGCGMASGFDIKDFCAAPIPALVTAAALVQSGVAENIVVVGGSSLPKLGMKFLYHLEKNIPVLEDMQAAVAVWVGRDDGRSPIINLAGVGRHPVSAGASLDQQLKALVVDPLNRLELALPAIDKFVTELHNPEITLPANGGDVAERNYRMLGAVLIKAGKLAKSDLPVFMKEKGLPGYAPTQGHIASALAYVPHAVQELTEGEFKRCFLFARASLFLGQMTQLSDGMSVMLERQP
jgi:glycine/sarcosine/betaine reductase complex component C subunit beta